MWAQDFLEGSKLPILPSAFCRLSATPYLTIFSFVLIFFFYCIDSNLQTNRENRERKRETKSNRRWRPTASAKIVRKHKVNCLKTIRKPTTNHFKTVRNPTANHFKTIWKPFDEDPHHFEEDENLHVWKKMSTSSLEKEQTPTSSSKKSEKLQRLLALPKKETTMVASSEKTTSAHSKVEFFCRR